MREQPLPCNRQESGATSPTVEGLARLALALPFCIDPGCYLAVRIVSPGVWKTRRLAGSGHGVLHKVAW